MRSSITRWRTRLEILAAGTLIAVAPTFGAQAAECTITTEVPEHLAIQAAPGLHAAPHLRPGGDPAVPHTATHGQLVLGKHAPRVLYHLPVFMGDPWNHPHNFQVVLAVSVRVIADRYCEVGELAHTVGQVAGNNFGTPRACPEG